MSGEDNLLKLRHIMHIATPEEQERYKHIVTTFRKNNQFAGLGGDDKTAQVLVQLSGINENFKGLVDALKNIE